MTDDYASDDLDFLRQTDSNIERGIHESNPRKARETDLSFKTLKENIKKSKIDSKIAKYNREYNELKKLAYAVEGERPEEDSDDFDYSEVRDTIEKYNKQAQKLAKIGAQILVFDKDINKLSFEKEQAARAIRVPKLLIGPLRFLTAAGRRQARLERETKELKKETEDKISKIIQTHAEEAIGKAEGGSTDENKFNSLSVETVRDVVKDKMVTNNLESPSNDLEKNKNSDDKLDDEKEKKKSENVENERKNRKILDSKTIKEAQKKAIEELSDHFNLFKTLSDSYGTHEKTAADHVAIVLYLKDKAKGRNTIVSPRQFAQMCGMSKEEAEKPENKTLINENYVMATKAVKFAELWREVVKDYKGEKSDPFAKENEAMFNFISNAVEEGLTESELINRAQKELSSEESSIVNKLVTGNMDIIKNGFELIASMDDKNVKDDQKNNDDERRQVIENAILERVKSKYGIGNEDEVHENKDDVPKEEKTNENDKSSEVQDENNEKNSLIEKAILETVNDKYNLHEETKVDDKEPENGTDNTSKDDKKPEDETGKVEENNNLPESPVVEEKVEEHVEREVESPTVDYVTQINNLTRDVKILMDSRNSLGEKADISKFNELINLKIAEINSLLESSVVGLKKEVEPPVEEKVDEPKVVEPEENIESQEDKEYVNWWNQMLPTLDDPSFQQKTDAYVDELRHQEAVEMAKNYGDKLQFNRERDKRIAEDKARRAAKMQERNVDEEEMNKRFAEYKAKKENRETANQQARKMLSAWGGLSEEALDEMERDESEMSPSDLVNHMKEHAPNEYQKMQEAYEATLSNDVDDKDKRM